MNANMKGVADVALNYVHFRPSGKAILTMSLPDYTADAIRAASNITISGCKVEAEPIEHPEVMMPSGESLLGNGTSAGVVVGKTVTISGLPGKTRPPAVLKLVKGFKLADSKKSSPVLPIPLPDKKFSLYSRFIVQMDSESEAQRLVRKFHMTPFKESATHIIRAEVIY